VPKGKSILRPSVPLRCPRRKETVWSMELATPGSRITSPLKSPVSRATGPWPVGKSARPKTYAGAEAGAAQTLRYPTTASLTKGSLALPNRRKDERRLQRANHKLPEPMALPLSTVVHAYLLRMLLRSCPFSRSRRSVIAPPAKAVAALPLPGAGRDAGAIADETDALRSFLASPSKHPAERSLPWRSPGTIVFRATGHRTYEKR
jgi:hypothetical protein